ncbi:hypothetical protein FRC04_008142 [Tulasnella sp. 424]|nr:hypothetical protein FRC04_008142 [Tulasnella sp. 424]KAG8959507.1 hypothetical protein FRC05_007720 [Tulasnella sp. 425]
MLNAQPHHLPLFQSNTAYFNPYEVKPGKRPSRAQLTVLEAIFQKNNKPSSATKKALAAQLDMPLRNVQVWFQNRRAKDKNLAAKAKAKAKEAAEAAAAADQAVREGVDEDEEDIDEESSAKAESSTPPAGSGFTLSLPSNLAFRWESVTDFRGNTPHDPASPISTSKIHPSPHQAAARSASDSVRTIGNPILALPPNDANAPAGVNLGRRKSLPAFHPSLQRQPGIPQIPSLPTVADVNRDSKSPEADARRFALGAPGAGSGASGDDMGHGGVYRSASSNRLSAAAAPYPTPTSRAVSGALMTYRSDSTPGTGVFRIPANPNPSNQSWQGTSTVNSEDASFPGGLRQQTSSTPSENNANQPYSFPPRPYGDIPRAGPLPSKDFVFRDSGGAVSSAGRFRDSPPSTANEDEDERVRGLMQSHRFGSFASEFSIESDATGTTPTTATSTEFSSLALGVPLAPGAAFRARYPGFGRRPGFGHANTDSGLGASYGMSSGSVAGLPGLSAGPVSYPAKFDAESRRASRPAHFIQDMASLAVDQFNQRDARDIDQGLSHNPLPPSLAVRRGVIRKSTSGVGLGRSPLGIQVPNSFGGHSYHEVPEESEHEPPQTAAAGECTQVFERPSFSLDSSAPSTAPDATSHGTASSPETYYNPSGSGQQTSSLDNSSFPNSLPTSASISYRMKSGSVTAPSTEFSPLARGVAQVPAVAYELYHSTARGLSVVSVSPTTASPAPIVDVETLITWISPMPVKVNGHFCDVFEGTHSTVGRVALKRPRIGTAGFNDNIIRNGTLVEYIELHPNVKRINLLCEAADAINYLHHGEIVHGDIKANNILIGNNGQVLLCDFGLTRTTDLRTSTAMKGAGTLRWQSPELWDGGSKSFKSDVYAFGMTVAEVLTGEVPFPDLQTDGAVVRAVLIQGRRPPKKPLGSSTGLSYESVWAVAEACWPVVPEERISMGEALQRIQEDPALAAMQEI